MYIDLLPPRLPPDVFETSVPNEILFLIFTKLPTCDFPRLSLVNKRWRQVGLINNYWRVAFRQDFPDSNKKLGTCVNKFREIYKKYTQVNHNIKNRKGKYFFINIRPCCSLFNFENRVVFCSNAFDDDGSANLFFIDPEKDLNEDIDNISFPNSSFITHKIHENKLFVCLNSAIHIFHSQNDKIDILKSISITQLRDNTTSILIDFDLHEDILYTKFSDNFFMTFDYANENYTPLKTKKFNSPGDIIGNCYYYDSKKTNNLIIWDLSKNCQKNILTFNSSHGELYFHRDKLFVDMPSTSCIEVWDLEKGTKSNNQYRYCEGEFDRVEVMQVYDDKFFSIVRCFLHNSIYIWNLKKSLLISVISDCSRLNLFTYIDDKLFFTSNTPNSKISKLHFIGNQPQKKRKLIKLYN